MLLLVMAFVAGGDGLQLCVAGVGGAVAVPVAAVAAIAVAAVAVCCR